MNQWKTATQPVESHGFIRHPKGDRREFIQGIGSLILSGVAGTQVLASSAFGCGGHTETRPPLKEDLSFQGIPPEGYVRLAFNESPYGPPPTAFAAIDEMLDHPYAMESQDTHFLPGINRYPDVLNTQLTKIIARLHRVKTMNVIPCCGISELLYMCSQAFLDIGRDLVMPDATFPLLRNYAMNRGTAIILVPYTSDHHVDLSAMLDAVGPNTSLVYLANPDNPTGTVLSFSAIKDFIEAVVARNSKTIVVVDEAYMDYVNLDPLPEAIPLIRHYPVIVGRTFSKAYGMAGLRGGYAIVRKDLSLILNGFLSGYFGGEPGWRMFEGNVNRLAGAAIAAALSPTGQDFVRQVRELNAGVREALIAGLNSLGYTPLESHTSFVFALMNGDGEHLRNWLCDRKILVQSGGSFHSRYGDWIRISVGDQAEVETFLGILAGYDKTSPVSSCFNVFYKGH